MKLILTEEQLNLLLQTEGVARLLQESLGDSKNLENLKGIIRKLLATGVALTTIIAALNKQNMSQTDREMLINAVTSENKYEERLYHVKNRCFNDQRYSLDVSKLEQLGWKATTSFEEGLNRTVDWYLNHRNNWERTNEALVAHPRFGQKEL